ncbi:Phosphotransferase enzyme family protein [Penicillium odoratum]|uniref:Phosphotransferase enzyme family protein n=1 Tax=Penicillium odoratum TaxID=1167516 RepID=UPI002547F90E|nr:Phosphotransferase enzyme family protein [Penicillium odoratum]KAJ5761236.1 Phosphotransferase enzyme family protein [Penicillium odoratum]
MPNVNHDGFEHRLALIKAILQEYGLQSTEIHPIAYEEDCPFQYNNFIYKIKLSKPATESSFLSAPSYTVKPPLTGVSTLVLRLSNPQAMGLNQTNRVQNEVAAMKIARDGLRTFRSGLEVLVPAIYARKIPSSSEDTPGFGWIMMEYKSGVPLDEYFVGLPTTMKKDILEQIADTIAGIEGSQLPLKVDQFGGLTIGKEGIISGEMTTIQGGPWKTYEAWWQDRLRDQLKSADKSPVLEGWRPGGKLRDRIEDFIAYEISSIFTQAGVDSSKRVLIHGDFTMNNMLVDPDTNQLTAVLDFDFSHIGPPAHLFFTVLQSLGTSADPTGGKLTEVQGLETLNQLAELERLICPFRLAVPIFIEKKTKEELAQARLLAEQALVNQLGLWGY